jgi:hypothetical protein
MHFSMRGMGNEIEQLLKKNDWTKKATFSRMRAQIK